MNTTKDNTFKSVIERAIKLGKKAGFCLDLGSILPLFFPTITHAEVEEGIGFLLRRKDVDVEQWEWETYYINRKGGDKKK